MNAESRNSALWLLVASLRIHITMGNPRGRIQDARPSLKWVLQLLEAHDLPSCSVRAAENCKQTCQLTAQNLHGNAWQNCRKLRLAKSHVARDARFLDLLAQHNTCQFSPQRLLKLSISPSGQLTPQYNL